MPEEVNNPRPESDLRLIPTLLPQQQRIRAASDPFCDFPLQESQIHPSAPNVISNREEHLRIALRLWFLSSKMDMAKRQRRGGETSQREDLARSAAGRDLDPRRKDEVLSVVKTLKRTGVGRRGSIVADPNLLLCNS